MSRNYGPKLPPGFKRDTDDSSSDSYENEQRNNNEAFISQSSAVDSSARNAASGSLSFKRGFSSQSSCQDSDISSTQVPESSYRIGPSLPHNFSNECENLSSSEDSLPGPSPSKSSRPSGQDADLVTSSASPHIAMSSSYGPALPPGFLGDAQDQVSSSGVTKESTSVFGPVFPVSMQNSVASCSSERGESSVPQSSSMIGPVIPTDFKRKIDSDSDSDSDECIGPLPSEATDGHYPSVADDFERRAMKMKDKLTGKDKDDDKVKREEWMTELPDNLGLKIGLGARTFRRQEPTCSSDRSGWTDTPGQKKDKKKSDEKDQSKQIEEMHEVKRNNELSEQLEKYNKQKRPETLLEMHKKKRKKEKKKKKNEPQVRRPFDHDNDMKINLIDPKRAKTLIDKSALLNTRFGHGASHFL